MDTPALRAGASQRIITPPLGVAMAGWSFRAAGDTIARQVHDDLYVKALAVQGSEQAWVLIVADVVGVDPQATERIRTGVAGETGLAPHAVLVCATHSHSGPVVAPGASAVQHDSTNTVQADGTLDAGYGFDPKRRSESPAATAVGAVNYAGQVNTAWKERFIAQAIEAAAEAWRGMAPTEIGYGEAAVDGVGSSRRVLLSDGTWADPRREPPAPGVDVVSRTEIDPLVRVLAFRHRETQQAFAAVVNYGSHPWIFNGPVISAELAGETARRLVEGWDSLFPGRFAATPGVSSEASSGTRQPIVLYTTGPAGDVTPIWNINIQEVWRVHPGETPEASLERRTRAFDAELKRLGGRLADGAVAALKGIASWSSPSAVSVTRREVVLPLKAGYRRPAEVLLADWQRTAPDSAHLTEVQVLRVGDAGILGLPGEQFTSLARAIRGRQSGPKHLVIVEQANDYGEVSYTGDRAAYELGGYELLSSPVAAEGGEILVEQAIALLEA